MDFNEAIQSIQNGGLIRGVGTALLAKEWNGVHVAVFTQGFRGFYNFRMLLRKIGNYMNVPDYD